MRAHLLSSSLAQPPLQVWNSLMLALFMTSLVMCAAAAALMQAVVGMAGPSGNGEVGALQSALTGRARDRAP
eukprot:6192316-Pleurochrysis_carterae.AAC.1